MAHLKMMANEGDDCMFWGEKALTMAKELGDEETLCHALASVGQIQTRTLAPKKNDYCVVTTKSRHSAQK
jgi:hypothetical protein